MVIYWFLRAGTFGVQARREHNQQTTGRREALETPAGEIL